MDEPIERFPDEVCVAFEELRSVIVSLEQHRLDLERHGEPHAAESVDAIIGRMVRWFSAMLRHLDEDEDE